MQVISLPPIRFSSYSVVNRFGSVLYHPSNDVDELRLELLDVKRAPGFRLMVDVGDTAFEVIEIDTETGEPICLGPDGQVFLAQ